MYVNLFWQFVLSGWNWLDMVVIGTAVVSIWGQVEAGGLVNLRLLRAFRVLRLIRRIPSLQKIVVALYASIPAMSNALALTFMVVAMYSIMAVSFFRIKEDGGISDRFGTFGMALFTMFQFSTGDGWTDVVREINNESTLASFGTSVFFVSFMIIVSIVLMQVVIAVLLEEFSKIGSDEQAQEVPLFIFNPNPFGAYMSNLSHAQDEQHLKNMMRRIWQALIMSARDKDFDDGVTITNSRVLTLEVQRAMVDGIVTEEEQKQIDDNTRNIRISFDALRSGALSLQVKPQCEFTPEHWRQLVVKRGLADSNNTIGIREFYSVLRECLYKYHVGQLNKTICENDGDVSVAQALKYLIVRSGHLNILEVEGRKTVELNTCIEGNVSDKLEQILLRSSLTMQDTLSTMSKKLEAIDKKVEAIDKKVETIEAVLEYKAFNDGSCVGREGGQDFTAHPRKPHQNVVGGRNIGSLVGGSSGSSKFNSKANRNMSTNKEESLPGILEHLLRDTLRSSSVMHDTLSTMSKKLGAMESVLENKSVKNGSCEEMQIPSPHCSTDASRSLSRSLLMKTPICSQLRAQQGIALDSALMAPTRSWSIRTPPVLNARGSSRSSTSKSNHIMSEKEESLPGILPRDSSTNRQVNVESRSPIFSSSEPPSLPSPFYIFPSGEEEEKDLTDGFAQHGSRCLN
jgi:hypothetical protein